MGIQMLVGYAWASVILFLLMNCLEKGKGIRFYHRIFNVIIYLLLISGLFHGLGIDTDSIYLIVLFMVMGRLFLLYYNDDYVVRSSYSIYQYVAMVLVAYVFNVCFINRVDSVFLSIEELKILIWILVIIYLGFGVWKMFQESDRSHPVFFKVRDEYIVLSYARLKNRYGESIRSKYVELVPLIYAILIYENYHRPLLVRKFDLFLYRIDREPRKFGIMQIWSKGILSDERSIFLGIRKLEKIYGGVKKKGANSTSWVLERYYRKKACVSQILFIYRKIVEFDRK